MNSKPSKVLKMTVQNNNEINPDGIVLYAKQPGFTSFKSLYHIKKALHTTKVGHTGTLDSFAQGLLVVCTGRLTRLAGNITEFDKTYEAVIKFGQETDTLDYTGTVIKQAPCPSLTELEKAVKKFIGPIMQTPPTFSAIHIDGKRASDLARKGVEVNIPARPVLVYEARILETKPAGPESSPATPESLPATPESSPATADAALQNADITSSPSAPVSYARIEFKVSKGTYIRTLAADIARECGSCAHLAGLYRKSVGNFNIADAAGYEELDEFTIDGCIKRVEEYSRPEGESDKPENGYSRPEDETTLPNTILHQQIQSKKKALDKTTAILCGFNTINLIDGDSERLFKNGMPLRSKMFDTDLHTLPAPSQTAVFTDQGQFCGLVLKNEEGRIKYGFVIN